MKILGRLRAEMDRSCCPLGRGAIRVGPSTRPAQGVPDCAPRSPGLLGIVRIPKKHGTSGLAPA